MPTMSKDEIFAKVKRTLVDALSVDDDEVTESATLTGDLGAESIDFLDIVFRLEKTFGIKIPQDELIPRDILSNPEFVTNSKMNADGLRKLQQTMPHADLAAFAQDPDINKISDIFTVGTIVKFVESKLKMAG
ncbi:MAG: Acyl carrier protein [Phycisphaerae bacterium]|nr:Acyl carrier protein [Phycisphaerae bacterium]